METMIDCFEIQNQLCFLSKCYPMIEWKVKYNPIGFYMNFTFSLKDGRYKYSGSFPCSHTEVAKSIIFDLSVEYLSILAKNGVNLNGSHD